MPEVASTPTSAGPLADPARGARAAEPPPVAPAPASAPAKPRRRWLRRLAVAAALAASGFLGWFAWQGSHVVAGYAAKQICSAVFVSGLGADVPLQNELERFAFAVDHEVDRAARVVTVRVGPFAEARALYRPGLGATLVTGRSIDELRAEEALAPPAAREPASAIAARPWPHGDAGATIDPAAVGADPAKLAAALDRAFREDDPTDPRMRTRAFVVVWRGRIVAERYAAGFGPETPLTGWSMTKSVTGALVGLLVGAGRLAVDAPLAEPLWPSGDPRAAIPLERFLRMESGLRFDETYHLPSGDPVRMLFRAPSTADYAARLPLDHAPGEVFSYSSGTTNLLARAIERSFGGDRAAHWRFPKEALFDRIGMRSAVLEPDAQGTFVGSSFMYATARDWARFGLLYLWDGRWPREGAGPEGLQGGARILPEGWVDYTRAPTKASRGRYGVQVWLNADRPDAPGRRTFPELPADLYMARGFDEQLVAVFPSHDLVVVRLGVTEWPDQYPLEEVLLAVLAALPRPAGA